MERLRIRIPGSQKANRAASFWMNRDKIRNEKTKYARRAQLKLA